MSKKGLGKKETGELVCLLSDIRVTLSFFRDTTFNYLDRKTKEFPSDEIEESYFSYLNAKLESQIKAVDAAIQKGLKAYAG